MKPKEYPLLEEAIEIGTLRGWNRAHKHIDDPTDEHIREQIAECVMQEICERFDLDEPDVREIAKAVLLEMPGLLSAGREADPLVLLSKDEL